MTEKLINKIRSNHLNKLPKFDDKKNKKVNKWLTDITNELNLTKLFDQQNLSIIDTFLVDNARHWFINNMATITDRSIFVSQMQKKTFSLPFDKELALKKVTNRRQSLNETDLHYYNDMMELFDMIDMSIRCH